MIPAHIIEKAIEGGWKCQTLLEEEGLGTPRWDIEAPNILVVRRVRIGFGGDPSPVKFEISLAEIALDPLFWQSLGKALGWNIEIHDGCCTVCGEPMPEGETMFNFHGYSGNCPKPPLKSREWNKEAHRFYDLILTGGDTEKFWEELLTNQ